ncbi:hypothetical protein [Mangrovibacterium diazotrophicum]|uniref:Uncharacterized protein n=1 Tax=Mangrovibacterium diazotrophicum TaxID=1261403 RepID=A0A419VUB2_9BACT|nr:hypothetical protein [Mangrovibacterium diazotrophicum]RKD85091.1 hypothetical protein BC643_4610 [Mangrovibacterium diazotrophicum]
MIDSSWTVVADDEETKFKYNQYKNDTSLACRTIADTIWNIMKSGISEIEAENLVSKFNSSLDMKAESKQVNNVSGFWDCYQYHWKDSKTGDVINLWKCKLKNNTIYGLWELEISNDSLLNHLNSKHDPYYKVYK